ncbi:hypothetical protein EW146_g6287 [Bondarzewia mesenterica]|uniref:Exoribonuclease phosphorolytic domain-containing protein n=1 Tax=Bondarzewia mesenterica TaxID=1095465 RepID=A0A4S4LNZ5_9AGAM|nr:hypothetical protein EW146_g6287 [Bondarzewia mesenterica]
MMSPCVLVIAASIFHCQQTWSFRVLELSMSIRRQDGRSSDELRPLTIVFERLDRADGSAQFGFAKALASVSGPIEVRLASEQPSKATFEVILRPLSNVPGTESKSLSVSLRTLLMPSILLSRNPRALIQLVVQSLTPNPSIHCHPSLIASFINASTLALLDAGSIPMRGVICSVAVGHLRPSGLAKDSLQSTLIVDPSEEELLLTDAHGCFAFMFSTELSRTRHSVDAPACETVWTNWESTVGKFDEEDFARAREIGRASARKIWLKVKDSVSMNRPSSALNESSTIKDNEANGTHGNQSLVSKQDSSRVTTGVCFEPSSAQVQPLLFLTSLKWAQGDDRRYVAYQTFDGINMVRLQRLLSTDLEHHDQPKAFFTLTDVRVTLEGSFNPSKNFHLFVDGSRVQAVFQKQDSGEGVLCWKIGPRVDISSISSIMLEIYGDQNVLSRRWKRPKKRIFEISGRAVVDACGGESGGGKYTQSFDGLEVTLRVLLKAEQEIQGVSDVLPQDVVTSPAPLSSSLKRCCTRLQGLRTVFDENNVVLHYRLERIIETTERICKLPMQNADIELRILGEQICDVISYISNPTFRTRLQSEHITLLYLMLMVSSAVSYLEDPAKSGLGEIQEDVQSRPREFRRHFLRLKKAFYKRKPLVLLPPICLQDDITWRQNYDSDWEDNGLLRLREFPTSVDAHCMSGTRDDLLKSIYSWVEDGEQPNIIPALNVMMSSIVESDSDSSLCLTNIAFKRLIEGPLMAKAGYFKASCRFPVIVIDGLEQCHQKNDFGSEWKSLLESLVKWSRFPPIYKLLVTSRPTLDILEASDCKGMKRMELRAGPTVDHETNEGMRTYVEHRLIDIRNRRGLPQSWPASNDVNALVGHAAGLFIWAETVLDIIDHGPDHISSSSLFPLRRPPPGFHTTVSAIAMAKIPLTAQELRHLLHDRLTTLPEDIFRSLKSIVIISPDGHLGVHQFQSSYLTKGDPAYLSATVSENIPSHLVYACRYWAAHLQDIRDSLDSELRDLLRLFFHTRFLFWLEVLSLINAVDGTPRLSDLVADRLQPYDLELSEFVKDASHFLVIFRIPIKESVPHIYLSALSFASPGSQIFKFYRPMFPNLFDLKGDRSGSQPAAHSIIWTGHAIFCLAFSPDGTRIASGGTQDVQIWNSATGACIASMKGNSASVHSLSFSANGQRIVSHSNDSTFWVWDANRGVLLYGPFNGYLGYMSSASLSPDGTRVVSVSPLRVWDIENTRTLFDPLKAREYMECAAFLPDGERIVSGSTSGTVRLWDAKTGRAISELWAGHRAPIFTLSVSPDARMVVSGSSDMSLRIWNTDTGTPVGKPLEGHVRRVSSVALVDSTVLSGSDDGTIRVWDTKSCKMIRRPILAHEGAVTSAGWSSDGTQAVSAGDDDSIRIWDWDTLTSTEDVRPSFICVHISGDGKTLLSLDSDAVVIWTRDLETGDYAKQALGKTIHQIHTAVFSRDGGCLLTAVDHTMIYLSDIQSGDTLLVALKGHTDRINDFDFSFDNGVFASGSDDQTVRVWNAKTGRPICGPLWGHTSLITAVAFSPDGTRIASASRENVRLWDVTAGYALRDVLDDVPFQNTQLSYSHAGDSLAIYTPGDIISIRDSAYATAATHYIAPPGISRGEIGSSGLITFSSDGKRVVSSVTPDNVFHIRDASTGDIVCGPLRGQGGWIGSRASVVSPDDSRLYSVSTDSTIRVWDLTLSRATHRHDFHPHGDWVSSVAFSPDGRYIASACDDNTILIQDAETGKDVFPAIDGHTESVVSISLSPNGDCLASGSDDASVRIWNARTGESVCAPLLGHTEGVNSVAWSPDDKFIASGSDDRTVKIWDANTHALLQTFKGQTGCVHSVVISRDGAMVVSGSADQSIRVWILETGACIGPFKGHDGSVLSIVFSIDGKRVVSGSDDTTIRIWNAETGEEVCSPLMGHSGETSRLCSADDKRIFFCSDDYSIRVWDFETGAALAMPLRGHEHAAILTIALSTDGARLASASVLSKITIWDVETFEHLAWPENVMRCVGDVEFCAVDNSGTFGESSTMENGWIVVPRKEKLFGVPPAYRNGLWYPRTTRMLGTPKTIIDFRHFVHGQAWEHCRA